MPQFKLTAFDSGEKSLEMKVIVGKDYEDKATPVFSDSMEFVIFRPYWNVTPAIAAKEIFPKGPEYLAANDMEVYNDHGRQAVRQRPGPKNALGFVKFMFPNDFNIYFHDTPNHELFKKDVRAFSHGCIRVEKPAELAQWVLGWTPERVEAAMHGTDNHQVNLPSKIPVYIVYFTTYRRRRADLLRQRSLRPRQQVGQADRRFRGAVARDDPGAERAARDGEELAVREGSGLARSLTDEAWLAMSRPEDCGATSPRTSRRRAGPDARACARRTACAVACCPMWQ